MGVLPDESLGRWMLLVSTVAFANTIATLINPIIYTKRVYNKEVTSLAGRLFGTWTLTASAVRLACAFDLYNATVYKLAFASYIIALGHFLSELFLFRTARLTFGTVSPLIVASTSLFWMWSQWNRFIR